MLILYCEKCSHRLSPSEKGSELDGQFVGECCSSEVKVLHSNNADVSIKRDWSDVPDDGIVGVLKKYKFMDMTGQPMMSKAIADDMAYRKLILCNTYYFKWAQLNPNFLLSLAMTVKQGIYDSRIYVDIDDNKTFWRLFIELQLKSGGYIGCYQSNGWGTKSLETKIKQYTVI